MKPCGSGPSFGLPGSSTAQAAKQMLAAGRGWIVGNSEVIHMAV